MLFPLLALGLTTISMLQGSVFGAVLPSLVRDLKLDWGLIGITMSAWTAISAISPFFIGRYIHSLKVSLSIVLVMLVSSLATIFTSFVRDFVTLNVVRVAGSFVVPFAWPLAAKLVATRVSHEERGIATAIYNTGSMFGLALGYLVVALVNGNWHKAMIVSGFLGVIYAVVLQILSKHLFYRESHTEQEVESSQRAKIDNGASASAGSVYTVIFWLSLGHFAAVYTWSFVFGWLSTFLIRELQLSYNFVALTLGLVAIVSSLLEIRVGVWSDKSKTIKGRIVPLYFGFIPSAAFLMVSAVSSSSFLTALFMFLALFLWRLPTPTFWAIFSDLVPRDYFERGSAIYVGAVLLAGIVSSSVNGFIVSVTGSMKLAIVLTSILLLLSPIFYTVAAKRGVHVK